MPDDLAEVFRREAGRCTATLIRLLGDVDLAEEAVAEAFAIAAQRWPETGPPPNPGGWITTTARNRALDRLRREATRDARHEAPTDSTSKEVRTTWPTTAATSTTSTPSPRSCQTISCA